MATSTNGNGGAQGAPSDAQAPQLNVLAQYIKDFSFENPNAPRSLQPSDEQPNINIQINVNAAPFQSEFEVELKFPVADPTEIERRLTSIGAKWASEVEQVDTYFAHPARDFAQTDEALACFDQVLARRPSAQGARFGRAMALARQGGCAEARRELGVLLDQVSGHGKARALQATLL